MSLKWNRWTAALSVAIVGAGLAGGCQEQQVKSLTDENTALRDENTKLQEQKQAEAAARAQAEAEAAAARQRQPKMADGGGGTHKPRGDVQVIEVAGDVLFGAGSDQVTAAGRKELDKVAATIKSRWPGNSIRVEGYTDSDPIKKSHWGTNEALSLARAQAVEKYLATKGISSGRIEAVGMGAAKPKATKAASRRVEIHILGN